MVSKLKKSELLIPGGSFNKIKTAFMYGADVVYAGTPDMSLRVKAKVSLEEMAECIEYAHNLGKKIYLTVNLFTHNKDIEKLAIFVKTLKLLSPDGIIVADPGVFRYIHREIPDIPLHVSTQANVCSYETAMFWYDLGAKLCVLGREVSFEELKEIKEKISPDLKLETFIHGSMCMSYSGRCLLSNFLAERSSNQGNCAHCCRWNYKLNLKFRDDILENNDKTNLMKSLNIDINKENMEFFDFFLEEQLRKGDFMEISEDGFGSYIMNSKDLCLMPKLNKILDIGIDSLKVEGRNKSEYYAGITARAYRQAIDDYYKNPNNFNYTPYMDELNTLQNRGYTYGFFDGYLNNEAMGYQTTKSDGNYRYSGVITGCNSDGFVLKVKNSFTRTDLLEFISPYRFETININPEIIIDLKNNNSLEKANVSNTEILIPFENFKDFSKNDLLKLLPVLTLVRNRIE